MFSIVQAQKALLTIEPTVKIQDYVIYRDVYLFRVQFASVEEQDYDPFFSVNINTGVVQDFSVLRDGDINEIADLFAQKRR